MKRFQNSQKKYIKLKLVTGRTLKQGMFLNLGKLSPEYEKECSTAYMSNEDMEKLGIKEGDTITVYNSYGSVSLYVREGCEKGLIFLPYGPWANTIFSSDTDSTGTPFLKTIAVKVEKGGSPKGIMEVLL